MGKRPCDSADLGQPLARERVGEPSCRSGLVGTALARAKRRQDEARMLQVLHCPA